MNASNSKNLWIIGIIVVAVLVVGWYLLWGMPGSGSNGPAAVGTNTASSTETAVSATNEQGATTAGNGQQTTGSGSLATAITQGGNYTCTVTSPQADPVTTGTIYASAGNTRLDFQSAASNGVVTTLHIIRSGSVAYEWVEGQTVGTKTAISASSPLLPSTTPNGAFVLPNTFSWDCHPWYPDQSEFAPPTAITFTAH